MGHFKNKVSLSNTRQGCWMNWIAVWWKTLRAPLFTTSIAPVLLGTAIAVSEGVPLNLTYFLLSLGVACSCQAGSNLINDYYDHLSSNDDINQYRSPFNGGSGSIQEGIVEPGEVIKAAVICYAVCLALGIVLFVPHHVWALLLVLGGICSGISYSKYPALSYIGLGELVVGLNFGPLIVSSAYFAQTGRITAAAIVISIPIGLLVAAVLYINQFPDFEADKAVNKKNIVVRLGLRRALPYYYLLLATAYLVIVVGVRLDLIPAEALVSLVTLPLAAAACLIAAKWYDNPCRLRSANAYTIVVQTGVGLLLTGAFVWTAIASYFPFIN